MEDSESTPNRGPSRLPPGLEDVVAEGRAVPAMPPGLVSNPPGEQRSAAPGRQSPPRRAPGMDGPQSSRQTPQQRLPDRHAQAPLPQQRQQRPPQQLSLEQQLQRPSPPQQHRQQPHEQPWLPPQSMAPPGHAQVAASLQSIAQQQARQAAHAQAQVMQSKAPSMRDPGGNWGGPGTAPGAFPGSMLPTPAAPSSMSPWAAAMHGAPSPASGYQAPGANSLRNRSQQAAAASLQKFAAAEEVRRVAEAQAAKEQAASTMSPASQPNREAAEAAATANAKELQKRLAAQESAQATAARINAQRSQGNAGGAGDSPSKDQEVSDDIFKQGDDEKRFHGRIKNFDFVQGFGFIQSPEIMTKYGCDAFLNHAVDGGIVVGGVVSFAIELNKAGKPQARRIRLEDISGVQEAKKAADPGIASYTASEQYRGRVKSFNSARGFGFISCPEMLRHMFNGRDIYVSRAQAPDGQLFVGQEVDFKLVIDRSGQPQARDIEALPSRRGMGTALPVDRPENVTGYNLFQGGQF